MRYRVLRSAPHQLTGRSVHATPTANRKPNLALGHLVGPGLSIADAHMHPLAASKTILAGQGLGASCVSRIQGIPDLINWSISSLRMLGIAVARRMVYNASRTNIMALQGFGKKVRLGWINWAVFVRPSHVGDGSSPVLAKTQHGTLRVDQETTELLTLWSWGLDC